jgi:hypothetical protein
LQNILLKSTDSSEGDKSNPQDVNITSFGQRKKRLTKLERSRFYLEDHLKEILIGNIMGDLYMRRFSKKSNTRIIFRQGSNNSEYLFHLFDLFEKFTLKRPSVTTIVNKENNKTRSNISFATLALPCFN